MTDSKPSKLTLEIYGNKIQWETPYADVPMEDLLDAFYGLCVAAAWHPKTTLMKMKEFAEERLEFMMNDTPRHNLFVENDESFNCSCTSEDYSDSIKYTQETR